MEVIQSVLSDDGVVGRSLALTLKALPSNPTVIAVGRRKDRLDQLSKDHGLETIQFDVNTDSAILKAFVDETLNKFPEVCQLTIPPLTILKPPAA